MSDRIETDVNASTSNGDDALQFVVVQLGKERFGVPILQVRSVEKRLPISKVPRMDTRVEGVVNLRGELVPVIDLRAQFGIPVNSDSLEFAVLINQPLSDQVFGIIVDSVSQISKISAKDLKGMPDAIASSAKQYVTGSVHTDEGMLMLVDLHRLIEDVEGMALLAN